MTSWHPSRSIRNDQYEPIGFAINFDVTFMTGTMNIFIFQRKTGIYGQPQRSMMRNRAVRVFLI